MHRRELFLGTVGALLLAGCGQDKPQFKAVDISGVDYARDFRLTDVHGKVVKELLA